MNTLVHADIFFFISSIGFILLTTLLAALLIRFLLIARRLSRIVRSIEEKVEEVGDEAKAFARMLAESRLLSWFFGKRRTGKKK